MSHATLTPKMDTKYLSFGCPNVLQMNKCEDNKHSCWVWCEDNTAVGFGVKITNTAVGFGVRITQLLGLV